MTCETCESLKKRVAKLEEELKVDIEKENKAFEDEGRRSYQQGVEDGYQEAKFMFKNY